MYHGIGGTRFIQNIDIYVHTSIDGVTYQKTTTALPVTSDRTLHLTQYDSYQLKIRVLIKYCIVRCMPLCRSSSTGY
jgi:hypothetical protein